MPNQSAQPVSAQTVVNSLRDIPTPGNLEAEQQLLGGLMYANGAIANIVDILTPDHFLQPLHGRIFAACLEMYRAGKMFNPITLKRLFDHDPACEELGGAGYLVDLVARGVNTIRVEEYARIIVDLAARRDLMCIGAEIIHRAVDSDLENTADRQIDRASRELRETMERLPSIDQAVTMDQALQELETAQSDILEGRITAGVSSGLAALDQLIGGFRPGQLVIVAGRPGMGKSALLLHFARAAAEAGFGAALASLEMSTAEIMVRMIAMEASAPQSYVPYRNLTSARVTPANDPRVARAWEAYRRLPIAINDRSPLTVQRIEAGARLSHNMFQRRDDKSLGMLLVDYLQLIKPEIRRRDRYEEITQISNDLKSTAKRLGIPLVVAAQINRETEKRSDKRPIIADLRDSGAIEQDADVILFPFRPAVYDDHASPTACEIIVAKNRQGPTGTIRVDCQIGSNFFWSPERML